MADATGGAGMDYNDIRRTFRWDVPAYYNFAVDAVGIWARSPDKAAMRYRDQFDQESAISYAAFDHRSSRLAAALSALGIGRGDPKPGIVVETVYRRYGSTIHYGRSSESTISRAA